LPRTSGENNNKSVPRRTDGEIVRDLFCSIPAGYEKTKVHLEKNEKKLKGTSNGNK
jgi:hypothetical protein